MKSPLHLKEIIYEITPTCHNNCLYCGSKDSRMFPSPPDEEIIKIVKAIAEYPPEEIDISGGDPLLIPYDVHQAIRAILKQSNPDIKIKIIINPKSFGSAKYKNILSILGLYDWVGISINDLEELKKYKEFPEIKAVGHTIITNFNIVNIFNFDVLEDIISDSSIIPWQIQFTMYQPNNLELQDLALYKNKFALTYLQNRIVNSKIFSKIILADNLNSGSCGAGISSCGILWTGQVIPCLSMRSWIEPEDLYNEYQGNVCEDGLKNIWENRFSKRRFCSTTCCKDVCDNQIIDVTKNNTLPFLPLTDTLKIYPVPYPHHRDVQLYSVGIPHVMAYAVQGQPTSVCEVVSDPNKIYTICNIGDLDTDK